MTFNGFTPPVSNYFRMPNEWVNISAKINNLAELKVVEYVLRHTWGYQEYDGTPKPITVDEFMHGRKHKEGTRIDDGTGLSKPSVIQGLKYAIEHGYLICEVDDADRARIVKAYALKMFSSESDVKILYPQNRGKESLPPGSNILTPEVKNLDIPEVKNLDSDQRKKKEKHFKKEREKDSAPSLPLSQKIEEETKPLEVDYALFDRLCQEKGYAPDFKVPRNEKNNAAIQELRSQGATPEQVEFVFNDLWDDRDPFWKQHRGKPSTVASQFTARVWKMTTPAPKRQTASGFTNWTENKAVGTVPTPSVPKATEKPSTLNYPIRYGRLEEKKPARARSLQARLQQEQKG